jgi:ABC-type antimicrobial peptide transport system permease subunit
VRAALGARPGQVVALVMGEGLRLAAAGLALGLAVALVAARLLESQLFGVTPHDGWSYASAAAMLGAIALLACWLPARRSVAISPLEALRAE